MRKTSYLVCAVASCLALTFTTFTTSAFGSGHEQKQQKQSSSKPTLHRADFRVEGASCVLCLRRMGKTFRDDKGVLKADVSIFAPYWSVIIYDSNQTNFEQLKDSVKKEHVRLVELTDKQIAEMPSIIIPKGLITPKGAAPTDGVEPETPIPTPSKH